MPIVDDLVENLVERNSIRVNGTLTVAFVSGGFKVTGRLLSTLRDQKKQKDVLNVEIPVDATVKVGDITIPVPQIK